MTLLFFFFPFWWQKVKFLPDHLTISGTIISLYPELYDLIILII